MRPRARGFTLLEVLTAVCCIGVLASLLLPAVSAAREQAQSTRCGARLRQLGLAVAGYEATHRVFPAGGLRLEYSAHCSLLPFLGHEAAYVAVNFELHSPLSGKVKGRGGQSLPFRIPEFICPADPVTREVPQAVSFRVCFGPEVANFGLDRPDEAPFAAASHRSAAAFTNGLSKTAFMSERLLGDQAAGVYTPARDYARSPGVPSLETDKLTWLCERIDGRETGHVSGMGSHWARYGLGDTAYNHVLPPNSRTPDCHYAQGAGPYLLGVVGARSMHPGGVHVLAGDGSVSFWSQEVDLTVWRNFGKRL